MLSLLNLILSFYPLPLKQYLKIFKLKLIFKFSALNSAFIFSLPSPELALLTDNWILSFVIFNFTPSFLSSETLVTLSIELINSFEETVSTFSLLDGTTFL